MPKRTQVPPFAFVLLILLCMNACGGSNRKIDITQWYVVKPLWRGSTGRTVSLFAERGALSHSNAIVCDSRPERVLRVLPPDTFPLISGSTLRIFDVKNSLMPGWYKITRNHKLNWWQRNFSEEPLAWTEAVEAPSTISMPDPELLKNGVFVLNNGRPLRVAEENMLRDLLDVPSEGVVFVGDPGLGVRDSVDLPQECP
jgi:hypothetical protein